MTTKAGNIKYASQMAWGTQESANINTTKPPSYVITLYHHKLDSVLTLVYQLITHTHTLLGSSVDWLFQ